MQLAAVRIENYRCLHDVSVDLDDLTVLVGANGSGKSTLLRGLDWLFTGGPLTLDDVFRHEPASIVRVSATFAEFTDADREALGRYVGGDTAIFTRTWSQLQGEKLTGRAFTYPPFDEIRAIEGAVARRTGYNALVEANPDLGLDRAANRQELDDSMAAFEQAHPDQLEPTEADATHLFGFVGGAKLNGRFAFVFVPAVSDAHEQLTGARGSLLSRLVERLPAGEDDVTAQLEALKKESQRRADELMREQHGEGLAVLGARMTAAVQQFVPDAEVQVDVHPPSVRVTEPAFDVRVADDGLPTDVAHQGHGFQRALILAALNELARTEHEGDVPAVLLAIEEPELYQHPLQARHFASVLSELPRRGEGSFQVAYATHSQFFIDPSRYERLRRFGRSHINGERFVTTAQMARVAERVADYLPAEAIAQRVKMTLEREMAEAVFADLAVLVEGKTDAGLLSGIADRDGGFTAEGIALVNVEGKAKIPLVAAILGELGIPVYTVFDADRGKEQRSLANATDVAAREAVAREVENTITWNRRVLRSAQAPEEDWPETTAAETYAVFEDRIEAEWPAAIREATRLALEANDSPKREQWYRAAARTLEGEPPEVLTEIVRRIRELR